MMTNQTYSQEKYQNDKEVQQTIFDRLSQNDQQKLTTEIVTYLMSPLKDTRIAKIAQKFKQIQASIIQVIEHRVKLQNEICIKKLQESHFEIVCQFYDKIKQQNLVIDELGKRYAQLDTKYLLKVAEVEQEKYYRRKLTQQNKRLKDLQKRKSNKSLDEQNQIAIIEKEIISLKDVMRTFLSSAQASPLEEQQNEIGGYGGVSQTTQGGKQILKNRTNHLSELQRQLKTLKSNLTMRLQMIEQSDEISQKYESTQQQLISRLMQELMRVKKQNSRNRLSMERNHEDAVNQSQLIHEQYERSQNSLNDLLQAQLVEMKQKLQRTLQQQQSSKSQLFDNLNKKIMELQKSLRQKDQQLRISQSKLNILVKDNQSLKKQFQQHKSQEKQRKKQLQLVYQTKIQQLQLQSIEETERLNSQLDKTKQKVQNLQGQIQRLNKELKKANDEAIQLNKNKSDKIQEKFQEINETNRSLQNEKILLKTLNKKLNKQLNDSQKKCTKISQQNVGLKNKIKELEQMVEEKEQIVSSLKLQLELKHQNIALLMVKLEENQKVIQIWKQNDIKNQENISQLKDKIKILQKKNQQNELKLKRFEQQQKQRQINQVTILNENLNQQRQQQTIQKQNELNQKIQEITEIRMDLNKKEQKILEKQSQLKQKQEEIKDKQNHLLKRQKELQKTKSSYEQKCSQNKKLQQTLNSLSQFLKQKQTELQRKESQLYERKLQVELKEKEVEKMEGKIQANVVQRQNIEAEDLLSPPPSPIQAPLQSPPISPSPFKLQSSQPMIPIDDDSIKIKLKFIDTLKEEQNQIPQNSEQKITNKDFSLISLTCQQLADNWMKSEQQKWNSLHFEIDSLYKMLVQSQL